MHDYGATPEQIRTEQPFYNAFGHWETEISARWIVAFCQERKQGWEPFTREEVEQFYRQRGYRAFCFNRLITNDQRYLVVEGEQYTVTPEFVERCYQAARVAESHDGIVRERRTT